MTKRGMTAGYPRLHSIAAALCLGTAALSAVPAGAGSLYLDNVGIGGGAITMNLRSFQEKKYQATYAQQYDFSCGSAALASLLTYDYNVPVGEQDVFKDMIENGDKKVIAESGFSLLDIKNYLARHGLEANGYRAPLSKLAEVRVPAIVLVNIRGYSHFVVLQGIQNGWVLLSDPANGMRSEPVGEFESQWAGIFFLILTNAEEAQRRFNAGERWAAAPPPPWELTRYTLDLATLAQPAMLGLGRF
jgi:predicted double-glycine peptidase